MSGDAKTPAQSCNRGRTLAQRVAELGQQIIEGHRAGGAAAAVHLVDRSVDEPAPANAHGRRADAVDPWDDIYARVRQHFDGQLRKALHGWELVRDRGPRDRLGREHVGTHRFDELDGVFEKRRV